MKFWVRRETSTATATEGAGTPWVVQGAFHYSFSSSGDVDLTPIKLDGVVEWGRTVREIVRALVRERESLSLQLSHAKGLLDEAEFEQHIDHYLIEPHPVEEMDRKAAVLAMIVPDRVDSELVSTVFSCTFEDAEAALLNAARQLELPFTRKIGESCDAAG